MSDETMHDSLRLAATNTAHWYFSRNDSVRDIDVAMGATGPWPHQIFRTFVLWEAVSQRK